MLGDKTFQRIQEENALDIELYKFGLEIFESRLAASD